MKKIICTIVITLLSTTLLGQDFIKEKKYSGDPLFDFVFEWWKTPYRYGGTTKKGIDCSAFTGKLAQEVYNTPLPRTASQQYKVSKRVPKEELKDGDLVFFKTRQRRYTRNRKVYYTSGWHVGVYLTEGWFIHSSSKNGVKLSNLSEPYYSKIYYGSGRYF
jgi:lipoprotein Spr